MKTSEQIHELAAALAKAQGAMESAKKDSANPFFKSLYADLASVVAAIRKPLSDHGLAYVQATDQTDAGGIVVETRLMHASGQWIESRLTMFPTKSDPQGIGSIITYARRYALQAIVGVPADDDDGNAGSKPGASTAEKIKAPKHYPPEKFAENLPRWGELVFKGKRTPDEIIATVSSGGMSLTQEQIAKIRGLDHPKAEEWTPTPEEAAEIEARERAEMGEQA